MSPLREQMIAQMKQRGFSVRTHQSYLTAVTELARFHKRSPDSLNIDDLQRFFNYLVQERELAPASVRLYLNGVRFLYLQVLQWESFDVPVVIPRKPQRIPDLLTRSEVSELVGAIDNYKHKTMMLTCYGCGLRLSELVGLQVRHIDGERRLLRVQQGKGGKDRAVIVSDALLQALRSYWMIYHPVKWLFPNRDPLQPLHIQSAQRVYKAAKSKAGIDKVGGIHTHAGHKRAASCLRDSLTGVRDACASTSADVGTQQYQDNNGLCALGAQLPGRSRLSGGFSFRAGV